MINNKCHFVKTVIKRVMYFCSNICTIINRAQLMAEFADYEKSRMTGQFESQT